jgi:hypothetical protein
MKHEYRNLEVRLAFFLSSLLLLALVFYGSGTATIIINSASAQQGKVIQTEFNSSVLSNTAHPKIEPNETNKNNIISNTTKVPITSSNSINSTSLLSKTPHPKMESNNTSSISQLNATAPKSITNSSLLSNTAHPKLETNSSH